jgi:hypothetical protein
MKLTKNIVFVHIPKAGGTSLRRFISEHVDNECVFPEPKLHNFPRYETLDTQHPMLFMSHLGFDFVRSADADSFVMVRNPVERLLSLYSYAVFPGKNVPLIAPRLVEGLSLTEFLTSERPEIRMNVDNAQMWQVASGYAARHRLLRLQNGATLQSIGAQALENLESAAVVGALDDIDSFYNKVAEYFGNDGPLEPQVTRNVSQKRVKWDDLTDSEKALVESCVTEEWAIFDRAKRG